MTALEQFIEILEDRKSISNGANVKAKDLLEACIKDAKELLPTEQEQIQNAAKDAVLTHIKHQRYGRE